MWAQINAPAGITITGASAVGSIVNFGAGWAEDSFYLGGESPWYSSSSLSDPPFASPYWAFRVYCASSCNGAGEVTLTSIVLSATESEGPSVTPLGSWNIWDQNRPGEWIWNSTGDPWPLTLAASDPSGVCTMLVSVGQYELPGPSAVPDSSRWQQCPDPTWTPSAGASVDTRAYISGANSLPITINAANAAGLISSYSETLHVDNTPVGVSLTSPDDANPTVWVNHAVTVDATATAGPSGVGGTSCSVNGGGSTPYATRGMSVDGDGVHVVSCTASNNAVGPQGQPDTATSSLAVHIDEAPPSITFGSQNPSDPTAVTVNARDGESGVAGGSVQMSPAGSTSWSAVPASFDGTHVLAHVDDAGLHGPYDVKATSCDNVGNCATATERVTLPLRTASDSEVSLTRIVPRCTVSHIRRGAKRTCTPPHPQVKATLRVPYGHDVTIHGLYTTSQGVPLAGQPVHILAAPANQSNAFTEIAAATTAPDGSWSAKTPSRARPASSARYTNGTATILPSSGQVTAIVPASIKLLRVWPRHVAWGGTVHLVGQLFGGYLPKGGALVRLRIGYGSTFNTYGVEEHVSGDGRFSTVASFGPGDPSVVRTYWFQIASLPMGNYPFAPAASQRVPVIVGGHPGTG